MALTLERRYSGIQGREVGQQVRTDEEVKENENADEQGIFKRGTEQVTDCQGKSNINKKKDVDISTTLGSMGQEALQNERMIGLEPPKLNEGDRPVVGEDIKRLRIENKNRKRERKAKQKPYSQWKVHKGEGTVQYRREDENKSYRNAMCPTGQALGHPAAQLLQEYAGMGCPVRTGRPWTREMMEERGGTNN